MVFLEMPFYTGNTVSCHTHLLSDKYRIDKLFSSIKSDLDIIGLDNINTDNIISSTNDRSLSFNQ